MFKNIKGEVGIFLLVAVSITLLTGYAIERENVKECEDKCQQEEINHDD